MATAHGWGVGAEFEGVELGDERLVRRLGLIVDQVDRMPSASFPEQMESTADREALYRFLGNQKVSLEKLLAGHVAATHRRIGAAHEVRILHDTTNFVFRGDREGLGVVERGSNGFFGHFALAVGADTHRQALGVLGVRPHIHTATKARRGKTKAEQVTHSRALPREEKESSRWEKLALAVTKALPPGTKAIHVMDQEADDFALLARLMDDKLRFVVRGSGARLTACAGQSIASTLGDRRGRVFRTVRLNRRPLRAARRHPQRSERDATLLIRWSAVELPRPQYGQTDRRLLQLNVVHVFEPKPPSGEDPIEWFLLTGDPVATIEDATRVVDHYRARWVIEEFFKALKTGCAVEKRQLTTYDGLLRALGIFVPMAWRLLALRELATDPETRRARAAVLFDDEQLKLLRVILGQRRKDHRLPRKPTIRDAMLAIAAIGGHIPNNGDPGWVILGRGLQTFSEAEAIWTAARSDQS